MQALDIVVNASVPAEPFRNGHYRSDGPGQSGYRHTAGWSTRDSFSDGRDSGLLVRPGDAATLASAILYFIERPDIRRALGKSARQRAQQFGTDRFASELARRLAEVAQGRE